MGSFPYGNPLLAMGGMGLNPALLMNPNSAATLASFANAHHATSPAAALSSLAAASAAGLPK